MRFCLPALAILWTVTATARPTTAVDAVEASPDRFQVLLENSQVRVVEYTLRPGERDRWHTHPPKDSYVVRGGWLRIHLANGASFLSNETQGTVVWMNALPQHYADNVGMTDVSMVLTEVKSAVHAVTADLAPVVDAMRIMSLALSKDDVALFRSVSATF
jgi:quercetin dioxygenase-like cupin family protein